MTAPHPLPAPRRRAAAIALALCASTAAAHGGSSNSSAAAAAPAITHPVQPGDTLAALAARYLGDARQWPQLQAHNQVANPRHLQPGTLLRIPMHLLAAGSAQIGFVHGQARVATGTAAAPAQPGQPLPEGAQLQVGPDSFVSVRLADGTVVRLQAGSDVQVQQLRRRGRTGDAQSVLELRRGSVESTVTPSHGGARHFEIRTPMASTSVRGTRFAVTLAEDGRTLASVTEGALAVAPHGGEAAGQSTHQPTHVSAGQGVAVAASGQVGTPRALLPAPDLAPIPTVLQDADFLAFTLTPVAQAVAYQVQLAHDADFTQILRSGAFAAPDVRLRGVDDGSYHLAVRAVDEAGLPGQIARRGITVKARPEPPLYQAPAAGGTLSRTQGTLQCTPVSGAARYRIQVATDAGFAAPLLDETRTPDCSAPVAALPPGHYHWRAASIRDLPGGQADQGPYAAPQPFAVADNPGAPDAGALQSGGDGAELQLRWPGTPGQSYRLQLAAREDFAAPLVDERLSAPAWAAAGLAPGAYFVRIQAHDPSGLESGFSTPRQIRVPAAVQTPWGQPITASDGRPLSRAPLRP